MTTTADPDEAVTLELDRRIRDTIRTIPDFPEDGVNFKDITTVLRDGALFSDIVDHFADRYRDRAIDRIVGIESRGFIFGAAVAHEMGIGLSLVRKAGKLPHDTVGVDYELEYGTDRVEIHADALDDSHRVVILDDLLATGGTCAATVELIDRLGAEVVEAGFLIELGFLDGRQTLNGESLYAITRY